MGSQMIRETLEREPERRFSMSWLQCPISSIRAIWTGIGPFRNSQVPMRIFPCWSICSLFLLTFRKAGISSSTQYFSLSCSLIRCRKDCAEGKSGSYWRLISTSWLVGCLSCVSTMRSQFCWRRGSNWIWRQRVHQNLNLVAGGLGFASFRIHP